MDEDVRLFWKIIVDTHCGDIRISKEIGLWWHNGAHWHRLRWKRIPLMYEIHFFPDINRNSNENCVPGPATLSHCQNRYLSVQGDCIHFNGGYLRVFDAGLGHDVSDWGIDLEEFDPNSTPVGLTQPAQDNLTDIRDLDRSADNNRIADCNVQDPNPLAHICRIDGTLIYWGINVRVDATLTSVPFGNSAPGDCVSPILYYPQTLNVDDEHVNQGGRLLMATNAIDGTLLWEILGQDFNTQHQYTSTPYWVQGMHQLSVYQNQNTFEAPPADHDCEDNVRFDATVDSAPLVLDPRAFDQGYPFDFGSRVFFVGYNPEANEGEPFALFRGFIRSIVFDPNASCQGCIT